MKKLLPALASLMTIFFAACGGGGGGGGNDTPPPPPMSPTGAQTLLDIRSQVQQASSSCASGIAPAMLAALSAKQQGASSAVLLSLMSQANHGDCGNLLMNILLQAKTVDNGQWIGNPASKQWLAGQVAFIINRIGAQIQSQGGNPAMALQLPIQQYVTQSFLPSMGAAGQIPELRQTVNGYF